MGVITPSGWLQRDGDLTFGTENGGFGCRCRTNGRPIPPSDVKINAGIGDRDGQVKNAHPVTFLATSERTGRGAVTVCGLRPQVMGGNYAFDRCTIHTIRSPGSGFPMRSLIAVADAVSTALIVDGSST